MKRRLGDGDAVPARLSRLDLADWSTSDPSAAFESWCRARAAWVAEGNSWPGSELAMQLEQLDAAITLPDEEWRW